MGRNLQTVLLLLVTALAASDGMGKPNLLLISIDTLRADRLGCYGYPEARTPALDLLAAEGVLFEHAYSTVPLTLPAHTSILTGAYPIFHGVRDNSGYRLSDAQTTLAEILKEEGYETGAFVGAFVLDSKFGLDQGFDVYFDDFDLSETETVSPGYIQRTADEVVKESIRWLEARSSKPFFAWVHLYDPHDPYTPPEPYLSRHPGRPYDGEIEFTDDNVGKLLGWLKKSGRYDDTLIVVVGDHGESLGEHGEEKHGFFIYGATLHVPMLFRFPNGENAGTKVASNVSIVDIVPTVIQVLSLPRNSGPDVQGSGLASLVLGKGSPQRSVLYAESYYPYREFGWSPLRSLITESLKFIAAPTPEVYRLSKDPTEAENLALVDRALANRLKNELAQFENRYSGQDTLGKGPRLDSESMAKLRALGYVALSAGTTPLPKDVAGLADPKDKIGLYNRLISLFAQSMEGQYQSVTAGYQEVLEEDPDMAIVRHKLGQAHFHLGNLESALEQFTKVIELKGDESLATFDLAQTYLKMGRKDDAIVGFERTLELDPEHYRAKVNLGVLYKNQGKLDAAVEQLEGAVRLAPRSTFALSNLGVSYSMLNFHQKAVDALERAYKLSPDNALVCANLGLAFRRMGNESKAREFLERAHQLDPRIPEP